MVIGAEAYGINPFILGVQERLVGLGYAVAVPDYYHGAGPTNVEAYDDFTEVIEHIGRLGLHAARARDLAATVDAMRSDAQLSTRGRGLPVGLLHRRHAGLARRLPPW